MRRTLLLWICLIAALSPVRAKGGSFTNVTREAGIAFKHVNGSSGEKFYVETMGSGACWFDHDNDGDIDLYLVNSSRLPGDEGTSRPSNRLYDNLGNGKFRDITDEAGVGDVGYGMGCAVGDIDRDGDLDLHVSNFGPNTLYRNEGNGRFTEVGKSAGIDSPVWSSSASFADIDRDGDLDLYVANYVDFTVETHKRCGDPPPRPRAYCHPDAYNAEPDHLFRNRGDGTFEEVGKSAGIANGIGKGLGVVFTDLNDDGYPDIYVANDKTINFLYLNQGNGTFRESSLVSGVGFSENGATQAGMGTDAADVNGDGHMDLMVTNLDYETNELYLNNGDLTFSNATFSSGLGEPNFLHVGFGADFLDYDNDGDKDILIANGHILDNAELFDDQASYTQPRSMLSNDGTGHFMEVTQALGPDFHRPNVGRGLASGDFDNDGDVDFVVVNSNREVELLRNDSDNGHHWIVIRLHGLASDAYGIGSRVRVTTGDPTGARRIQVDEVRAGSSYLSQNDLRLHFGLGHNNTILRIEVFWPSGLRQILKNVPADQVLTVKEPPLPDTPSHRQALRSPP